MFERRVISSLRSQVWYNIDEICHCGILFKLQGSHGTCKAWDRVHWPSSNFISVHKRGYNLFWALVDWGRFFVKVWVFFLWIVSLVGLYWLARLRPSQLRLNEINGARLVHMLLTYVKEKRVRLEIGAVAVDAWPITTINYLPRTPRGTISFTGFSLHLNTFCLHLCLHLNAFNWV